MYYLAIAEWSKAGSRSAVIKREFYDLSALSWWDRWGLEAKIAKAAREDPHGLPSLGKWVVQDLGNFRFLALVPDSETPTKTVAILQAIQGAMLKKQDLMKAWGEITAKPDTVSQIVKDLEGTRETIRSSIATLLNRGEKLEHLNAKSAALVQQSKEFKVKTKRLAGCWGWLWCF